MRIEKKLQTRNRLIEEINQNELMSKKHKSIYRVFNHIEHSLIAISAIAGCVSMSAFASLAGIPIGIASSATEIKISLITAEIKNHKSRIKKKGRSMIKYYFSKI